MKRRFLFLQGPHGPFFYELSRKLMTAGQDVHRIGINQGDAYYWPDRSRYTPFVESLDEWEGYLTDFVHETAVTDIVIYGDARRFHSVAKDVASKLGLRIHCFEEGYLRPYWVTYERGGSNGTSALMNYSMDDIRARVGHEDMEQAEAPAQWGPVWRHTFHGSIYHANILFRNGKYPEFKSHRTEGVMQEWVLHCKRLALYLPHAALWRIRTKRLLGKGLPYHVAMLQLAHDASVQHYSSLRSMEEFIKICVEGFAKGAPIHHQLVFKTHPLEDGRESLKSIVKSAAAAAGIKDRVWFIPGGRLGLLLDRARSAITINSTAGQQALWRGLPLKTLGQAVYVKPEFVSDQSVSAFFANPNPPDQTAYRQYRQFLLETSQFSGGYYTTAGRRNACRYLVDAMLAEQGPYDVAVRRNATFDPNIIAVSADGLTR